MCVLTRKKWGFIKSQKSANNIHCCWKIPRSSSFSSFHGKPNTLCQLLFLGFKAELGYETQARFTRRLPSRKSVVTAAHSRTESGLGWFTPCGEMIGRRSVRQSLLCVWVVLQDQRGQAQTGQAKCPLETVQGESSTGQQSSFFCRTQQWWRAVGGKSAALPSAE